MKIFVVSNFVAEDGVLFEAKVTLKGYVHSGMTPEGFTVQDWEEAPKGFLPVLVHSYDGRDEAHMMWVMVSHPEGEDPKEVLPEIGPSRFSEVAPMSDFTQCGSYAELKAVLPSHWLIWDGETWREAHELRPEDFWDIHVGGD